VTDSSPDPSGLAGLVSVIVPAYNRAELIGRQLDALASQRTTRSFEVIVVDNGSTDATASVARAFVDRFAHLEVVAAPQRRGAAYARNVGAAAASGELLAYCDSDDIVHTGWLDAMAAAWSPGSLVAGRIRPLRPSEPPDPDGPVGTARTRVALRGFLPFADSASLAIGRTELRHVGGFDESYRFSSDVELSWRAQLAGLRFVEEPRAIVFKRAAPPGWIRFRQYHRWGQAAARLYRRYQSEGMGRRPARAVLRSWAVLGMHTALALSDPGQRDVAVRQAGWYTGYAAGSLRYRVLYL
jgi:glycosyltransferase involved in cell wall biosynthesis